MDSRGSYTCGVLLDWLELLNNAETRLAVLE